MNIISIIMYGSIYSTYIPLIFGVWSCFILRKTTPNKPMRILLFYVIFTSITELTLSYYATRGINNLWVSHVQTPIEYICFASMFYLWQKNRVWKMFILFSTPVVVLAAIIGAVFIEGIQKSNSTASIVELISLFFIAAITFFHNRNRDIKTPQNLISIALVLYTASSLPSEMFYNDLIETSVESTQIVLTLINFVNILTNVIYALSFISDHKKVEVV